MKLEKIAKSIENIKKNAKKGLTKFSLALLLSASTIMPLNCCLINEAPDTQITKKFKDNGEVEYTLSGIDLDGSVDYISAKFNDGNYQNFANNTSVSVPIIEENNTIEAIAYDNQGLDDPTPATDSFVSPTEERAKELMRQLLLEKGATFEKDVLMSPGALDNFYVDYLIEKKDGPEDAVVNYVGYKKDLEEECSNRELLGLYGIPNRYFIRIPENEIISQLLDFEL